MKVPDSLKEFVVSDPELMSGEPCFRGTRVPFALLMDHLEAGLGLEDFLKSYPWVEAKAARAGLDWILAEAKIRLEIPRAS